MHDHTLLAIIAYLIVFTAGFLVCEFNLLELKTIYLKIKESIYKS